MPMAVIQLFTTTITVAKIAKSSAGRGRSSRRCVQSVHNSGSNTSVQMPCRMRIDTSLCMCGVIAAQRFTGISSEQNTRNGIMTATPR